VRRSWDCQIAVLGIGRVRAGMSEPAKGLTQAALTELAGLLTATSSFEDLMQAVADLVGRAVPAATTCGITLAENGHVITVASADALARLLDEQQYEVQDGPCLEAIRTARVVLADDLTAETRWDGYPAMAVAQGVRAVLSSPLLVNDALIGALNLYAVTPRAFDADSRAAARQLTALAAATVTAVMRHYDQTTLTDHLRTALSSRSVIDQAIGIIIGMQRCPPQTAFDILRTASQNRNVPLRDIAADLVATTIAPPTKPPPD
jgi:GAF domain-containing protein